MGDSDSCVRSADLFRTIFENALNPMVLLDDAGRYVDANPAALEFTGLTLEELRRERVHDHVMLERAVTDHLMAEMLESGKLEGELGFRRSDGRASVIEFRTLANVMPGRHLTLIRDITERRRALDTEHRLAAIVDSAGDAIYGGDVDGFISFWSRSAERIYGYTAEEVIGKSCLLLIPPESRGELPTLFERIGRGEHIRFESVRWRKDGSRFEAAMTVSPTTINGEQVGVSVIARDLSETRELERRLAIADRMASIGTLAAGVAHEINNPLASVAGNLEYVVREVTVLERDCGVPMCAITEAVDDARVAADRIRNVVRDLKMFSRSDDRRSGPVDIRRVIESTLQMAWTEIRHRARLVKDYAPVPAAYGNDARLGQVILNLVINAAHAIPEGNAENNEIRIVTRAREGGGSLIEVHDTGTGIARDDLPRLFEPFFTTKEIGTGTGLGLPICQRIVHEMGGEISVDSEVGKGTIFRVRLPPPPSDAVEPPPSKMKSRPPARRGRILVVDDDPMIGKTILRSLGTAHDARTVSTARAALESIGAGERYDVIVCDLMMPQMTGMDLHAELSKVAPDQAERMVFMTGGAFTPRARAFLDHAPNRRFEKPFDVAQFRTLIDDRVR